MTDETTLRSRIKRLIVESLHLDGVDPAGIADEAPLFGEGGLGLDSVDALELVVALEKDFGLRIASNEVGRDTFASVGSLARFVGGKLPLAQSASRRG